MANTHIARKSLHVPGSENILNQANGFLLSKLAVFASHDSCRILATMLKHGKRIVQPKIYVFLTYNSDNTAHKQLST